MKNTLSSLMILSLSITLGTISCSKKKTCQDGLKGKFEDLTGLDGCGIVIELENGDRLEPVNLSDFIVNVEDEQKIRVKYHLADGASVCMVGDIVEIECIVER